MAELLAINEVSYEPPPVDEVEEEKLAKLRAKWEEKAVDILSGVPPKLPPLREVNHKIPLIDEKKVYNYHLPRCPDAMKSQLIDKIQLYRDAGWWDEANVPQAAPMLCVAKKDGKTLRTVIDARKRNDNTVKDVTPFPDQEQIRNDVARAPYRSKIDLSNAYEQIRIEPCDIWKTAFATVFGTYLSNVMQQGDCNAPATFQRLMTVTFRIYLGKFVHVYLDDIFVYSYSIEEHEEHLGLVFNKLRESNLYCEKKKVDLYSTKMDCLGHVIDNRGIHADPDKMTKVHEWPTPKDKLGVQQFLGLIQYLAHFMLDVSAWTGPLAVLASGNRPFLWNPMHQVCFDNIKALAVKTPILKPVDARKIDPIWVICDASVTGVGAVLGQGPEWRTCRPAGFMSKKFTTAQWCYRVFEMETMAILEALLKWEDKLIGNRVNVVTDHQTLEFFQTQRRLSNRQMRWMEYLSRFDFKIIYVRGVENQVADSLSRYFQYDDEESRTPLWNYVNADLRLDPEGEDLPWGRIPEIRATVNDIPELRALAELVPNRILWERKEDRDEEAARLADSNNSRESANLQSSDDDDPTIFESISNGPELTRYINQTRHFVERVRKGYENDKLFAKIIANPTHFKYFQYENGMLYTTNRIGEPVLCIPRIVTKEYSLTAIIIDQAHKIIGHFGPQRTADYIRRWYWWPRIGQEVEAFCNTCGTCQATKDSNRVPVGLLHSLPIPSRPWGSIAMDFVGPFPKSNNHDYLWVVIC